jgi:hypothetical protein
MRLPTRSIGCALISLIAVAPDALARKRATDPPDSSIVLSITIKTRAKGVQKTVPRLIDEADAVWKRYGVRLTREGGLQQSRITVVIVDEPLQGTFAEGEGERGLGWITFLTPAHPRNVIYLSWSRTQALLGEMIGRHQPLEQMPENLRAAYLGRALGRTLAHELGHYLFASTEHARSGLMRANYSAAQLFDQSPGGFQLDADREQMIATIISAALRSGVLSSPSAG